MKRTSKSEYGGVPEWPKGADCKSVGTAFGGSNPPPSTIFLDNVRSEETAADEADEDAPLFQLITLYRGVEQLAARRAHNPEVGGSSPPPATKQKSSSYEW